MYTEVEDEAECDKRMWSNEVLLTRVKETELIDVRFANAAEHNRNVSREFDIIIRSEKRVS